VALLADLTDPSFLDGLHSWSLDVLHQRRREATEVETGLSYLRRIVQGRLDIAVAARDRCRQGAGADPSTLVEQLPQILSGHVQGPGLGRLTALLGPGELDPVLSARLEEALPEAALVSLDAMDQEELGQRIEALSELERHVSAQRRAIFAVIDTLQEEIVRRYKTGEATVDNLLS